MSARQRDKAHGISGAKGTRLRKQLIFGLFFRSWAEKNQNLARKGTALKKIRSWGRGQEPGRTDDLHDQKGGGVKTATLSPGHLFTRSVPGSGRLGDQPCTSGLGMVPYFSLATPATISSTSLTSSWVRFQFVALALASS